MNNEQQHTDERFALAELKYGGFSICDREATDDDEEVCYYRQCHPYAKKAAEAERDRLNAWNKEGGNIRPVEVHPKPRRRFQESGSPRL